MVLAPVVTKSVEIAASPGEVWQVLTEPDGIEKWMGGARVKSTWELGADITFTGKLFKKPYRDRGTVLAVKNEKLLKYSYWSSLSRLPDTPENRSVITLSLDCVGEKTSLSVRHERFHNNAAYKHSNYFWTLALNDVKSLVESSGAFAP